MTAEEGATKNKPNQSVEIYRIYISKVLQQVHRQHGISAKAMSILNSILTDIFEQLAQEAARLTREKKKSTVTVVEIETAARLVLPSELAKHAIAKGMRAVAKFTSA